MDLLLTGRRMGAKEAAHHGLVSEVLPGSKLMDRARELADYLAVRAPLSIAALKEVLRATEHVSVREAFALIKSGKLAHGVMSERREGLNIVHWRSKDFGFMVIGDMPDKELGEIARKLKQQLS